MEFLQFFSPLLLDVHHVFWYGKVFKSLSNKKEQFLRLFLQFLLDIGIQRLDLQKNAFSGIMIFSHTFNIKIYNRNVDFLVKMRGQPT